MTEKGPSFMTTKEAEKTEKGAVALAELNCSKKIDMDPKEAIVQKKQVFLCRVWGEVTMVKTKENRSGDPYSYLVGQFMLVAGNGITYESGKLYLPTSLQEEVESAWRAAGEIPTKFAYDVFSNYDKSVSIGYRYSAKRLIKTEATDRLAELASQLESIPVPKIAEVKA
jgi:hypothetical protein